MWYHGKGTFSPKIHSDSIHLLACLADFTGKFSNQDHKKKTSQGGKYFVIDYS